MAPRFSPPPLWGRSARAARRERGWRRRRLVRICNLLPRQRLLRRRNPSPQPLSHKGRGAQQLALRLVGVAGEAPRFSPPPLWGRSARAARRERGWRRRRLVRICNLLPRQRLLRRRNPSPQPLSHKGRGAQQLALRLVGVAGEAPRFSPPPLWGRSARAARRERGWRRRRLVRICNLLPRQRLLRRRNPSPQPLSHKGRGAQQLALRLVGVAGEAPRFSPPPLWGRSARAARRERGWRRRRLVRICNLLPRQRLLRRRNPSPQPLSHKGRGAQERGEGLKRVRFRVVGEAGADGVAAPSAQAQPISPTPLPQGERGSRLFCRRGGL